MEFLMDFFKNQDHFTIEIWQKYLLLSGLKFEFLWTEIHFFCSTPDIEIALKTEIFKIFGYVRNGTSINIPSISETTLK